MPPSLALPDLVRRLLTILKNLTIVANRELLTTCAEAVHKILIKVTC